MNLELGTPYSINFDLKISGTSQKPAGVRAVFVAGDSFIGFPCTELTGGKYQLEATVPPGAFTTDSVMLVLEAMFGNQVFKIYSKALDLIPAVDKLVRAPDLPTIGGTFSEPAQTALPAPESTEPAPAADPSPVARPLVTKKTAPAAPNLKVVDLTVEEYKAPAGFFRGLTETVAATPAPADAKRVRAPLKKTESTFKVRRLKKSLLTPL